VVLLSFLAAVWFSWSRTNRGVQRMAVIYLGMALSNTPIWWNKTFHSYVLEELETLSGVQVSRFSGLQINTTAAEVYEFDIDLAKSAVLMVALTRFPSIGLGMEIQGRVDLKKPTLILHPAGGYLSKMPRGAPGINVDTYTSIAKDGKKAAHDIAQKVQAHLQEIKRGC
jgi:hypothetical protein